MQLSATCWEGEEALHTDYIPEGSIARSSLLLSELIGIRDVLYRQKDAIYLQRHKVRAVLLQYKTNEEAPQEKGLGQNVLWCIVINSCHVQTGRKRRNASLQWNTCKGNVVKFVFSYSLLGFACTSKWKVGSSSWTPNRTCVVARVLLTNNMMDLRLTREQGKIQSGAFWGLFLLCTTGIRKYINMEV